MSKAISSVVREILSIAKELAPQTKQMFVVVKLDGRQTVKRLQVPTDIAQDMLKLNEFARKYFQDLGYKAVVIDRWS